MSLASVFHPLRVAALERLTDDAVALTFDVPPELREEFAFLAGQHVTVLGPDGVRRPYSLCSTPSSGTWRIGIKQLAGGAFSEGLLSGLGVGDTLQVMAPSGRFTVTPDPSRKKKYVAIAAGSGITPLLSIVASLLAGEPKSFVTLVYVNRTASSVMFADEVADLKDRYPARFQVLHVLSREQTDVELLSGRLDGKRLRALMDAWIPAGSVDDWFLCGPQQMVRDLAAELVAVGVARTSVHSELFHADPVTRPAPAHPRGPDTATVRIRLGGRESEFVMPPSGPPVLQAALAVRPDLPFACRGGVCGTCRARLVEGSVDMDANWALEDDEVAAGFVLTCQSHPTSARVVLDYDA